MARGEIVARIEHHVGLRGERARSSLRPTRSVNRDDFDSAGLIDASVARADSAFGCPIACVRWTIWRWRFVRSTVSPSQIVMRPTPAEARYSAIGEPRPPAPITSACDASSRS